MIFGELDANGWATVIAAVFIGVAQIVGMILAYKREEAKKIREEIAAAKVEEVRRQAAIAATKAVEVKETLQKTTEATTAKITGEIKNLAKKIETNGA